MTISSQTYAENLNAENVTDNNSETYFKSKIADDPYEEQYVGYLFNDNYTFKYKDGMMRPIALEGSIKNSKFNTSYVHLPLMLDWNIKHDLFFAAGVNLDILMSTQVRYKFPKTIIQERVTVNPVQVGVTARVGWKRLYGYVNYSFIDLFREGTGPKGKRLSAGVGIWF